MKEIEVKAQVEDLGDLQERLVDLGCVFGAPVSQRDIVYLADGVTLDNFAVGNAALRLRYSGDRVVMTLKKKLDGDLSKIEHETVVADGPAAHQILEHMGYREVSDISKERIMTQYDGMEICLDVVKDLGSFIEVEKLFDDAIDVDSDNVQAVLWVFLQSLGVDTSAQVFKGYDVLMHERSKNL